MNSSQLRTPVDLAPLLARPPLAVEGPVLDYLGDEACRLPTRRDEVLATWLVKNRDRLAPIYQRVVKDPMRRDEVLGELDALAGDGVSADELRTLVKWGDFSLIFKNVDSILSGDDSLTETSQFALEHSNVDSSSELLDVGLLCGRHALGFVPREPKLMVGVDLNLTALLMGAGAWEARGLGGRMNWVCANALDLPFRDASFTHLHNFGLIILLPIHRAFAEFRRVLKPGGRLIVTGEGFGSFRRFFDLTPLTQVRSQFNLLRMLTGDLLLGAGFDWQRYRLTRRLAVHVQFHPRTIRRMAEAAGFDVDRCDVIRNYKGWPWIIALSATRRDDP